MSLRRLCLICFLAPFLQEKPCRPCASTFVPHEQSWGTHTVAPILTQIRSYYYYYLLINGVTYGRLQSFTDQSAHKHVYCQLIYEPQLIECLSRFRGSMYLLSRLTSISERRFAYKSSVERLLAACMCILLSNVIQMVVSTSCDNPQIPHWIQT